MASSLKLLLLALLPLTLALLCPSTESSPNPIFGQYPTTPTGTINGTILILPIPLTLARSIIPSSFPILTAAYQALLPRSFPRDHYPMFLQSVLDHDIRAGNISVPDFSRAVLSFPFVDLLSDGHSSFRYSGSVLISDNPVAVGGAALYGPPAPVVGSFDPPCDGYRFAKKSSNRYGGGKRAAEVAFDGYLGAVRVPGQKPVVSTRVEPVWGQPYSMAFFRNVTNQPSSGELGKVCDNFITLFNSSVSTGMNKPVPVRGSVVLGKPFFKEERRFEGVYGLKVDLAFVENNYIPCGMLKGYSAS